MNQSNFAPKRKARYKTRPTWFLASVRAVFRAYADVITRFLGTIGSKILFSYGAPLKRLF